MRVFASLLFICFLLVYSCQMGTTNEKHRHLKTEKNKALFEMTNDKLWNYLVFENGGCLTGGQHVYGGKFGGEGCVMSESDDWKIFFERDKSQISNFLIAKIIGDTTKTSIHTCPFSNATEGEVAIYSLQKIYGLNWFDFEEFNEYQNRESESSRENHQAWLQNILEDESKKEMLIDLWTTKIK